MSLIKKSFLAVCCFAIVSASAFTTSLAQDKPPTPEERAYKFRTSLFQTFGFKLGRLASSKAQDDEAMFKKHATDLQYLATMLVEGFEIKNSLPEGTAAKPNIWEDFGEFEKKIESCQSATAVLLADGAMESFDPRDFGSKNSGGCHREFRVKRD